MTFAQVDLPKMIDAGLAQIGQNIGAWLSVALPDQVGSQVRSGVWPERAQTFFGPQSVQATVVPPNRRIPVKMVV